MIIPIRRNDACTTIMRKINESHNDGVKINKKKEKNQKKKRKTMIKKRTHKELWSKNQSRFLRFSFDLVSRKYFFICFFFFKSQVSFYILTLISAMSLCFHDLISVDSNSCRKKKTKCTTHS